MVRFVSLADTDVTMMRCNSSVVSALVPTLNTQRQNYDGQTTDINSNTTKRHFYLHLNCLQQDKVISEPAWKEYPNSKECLYKFCISKMFCFVKKEQNNISFSHPIFKLPMSEKQPRFIHSLSCLSWNTLQCLTTILTLNL